MRRWNVWVELTEELEYLTRAAFEISHFEEMPRSVHAYATPRGSLISRCVTVEPLRQYRVVLQTDPS